MSDFPLRYASGNLLIGPGGEAAALYRAAPVPYPFASAAEKWGLLARLERFAHLVGADFSLWRVQRAYPAERYVAELEGGADPEHADSEGWRRYLRGHEERLAGLDSHLPEVYLAVSLSAAAKGHRRSLDRARRRLEELAGVGAPRPIPRAELEALRVAEERAFGRLGAVAGLRRASTAELGWLLRRAACRGVAEPVAEPFWEPDALVLEGYGSELSYEPLENDLWRCANAPMSEEPGEPPSLLVEAEEGDSYQAFLCGGSLAEEAEFPGAAELLHAPLEGAGFPVDAVLHAHWVGNREALGQVRKRILDVEHAYREQAVGSGTGPGWQAEEDRELAREYEAVLQSSAHPPMLRASLSLAVGAPDRAELERRVEALRERFGEVRLHRPRGLQHRLFFEHLPRADGGSLGDYRQQMTVEQFGAMVPTASAELGSATGVYVGHTHEGRPVRFDPTEAPRTARASGGSACRHAGLGQDARRPGDRLRSAAAGQPGGRLRPKARPRPRPRARARRRGRGAGALRGAGAPRQARPARDRPAGAARGARLLLSAGAAARRAAGLGERDRPRGPRRGAGRRAQPALRRRAPARRRFGGGAGGGRRARGPLGLRARPPRLRAGPGGRLMVGEPSVITIRTPGLSLPDPGASRETYTRAERVCVATLTLVAAQALRLVSGNRERHKIVLLDEAWFFLGSAQGRALLNRLVRLARAFNATVLVATQRLADLGELSELFGVYLVFGQETEAEARAGLAQIGLDPDSGPGAAADRIPPRPLPDARPRRAGRRAAGRPCLRRAPRGPRHHAEGCRLRRAPGRLLRPLGAAIGLAVLLVLCAHPLAGAASDVWGNVGPASQLGSRDWRAATRSATTRSTSTSTPSRPR